MRTGFAHLHSANRKWLLLWTLLGCGAVAAVEAPAQPALTASAQSAAPPLSREQAALFALPTTRDHIGRVIMAVTVNGKGPFRFIVDTGATRSTVSPDLVRALGLKPSAEPVLVLNGITGTSQVSAVTLDSIRAGDLTIDGSVVPVVPESIMAGADGIFGAAELTEKSLSIDFERNRVEISDGVSAALRAQALRIHATRVSHGLMVLAMRVGRVHALAVIDTGSERTLGNLALRNALDEGRRSGAVALVTFVYGATMQVERGEIWRAPIISIDSLRISDVHVVYGDFHVFKVWGLQDQPAIIIGMDVLGTVASLGIDFKDQVVYLTSSRSVTQGAQTPASLASPNMAR